MIAMPKLTLALLFAAGALISGCKGNETKPEEPAPAPTAAATTAPEPARPKPVCPPEPPATKKKLPRPRPEQDGGQAARLRTGQTSRLDSNAPAAAPSHPNSPATPHHAWPVRYFRQQTGDRHCPGAVRPGTMVKGGATGKGEITGVPAAGTTFTKLRIGMSRQTNHRPCRPTDRPGRLHHRQRRGFRSISAATGRWEMAYQSKGRLIFSQNAGFGNRLLSDLDHPPEKDTGYR